MKIDSAGRARGDQGEAGVRETTICATCHAEGTGRCSLPRCGWKPPEIVTHVTGTGEIGVTMPSGRITFMGWWAAIRFLVPAIFRGFVVKVKD